MIRMVTTEAGKKYKKKRNEEMEYEKKTKKIAKKCVHLEQNKNKFTKASSMLVAFGIPGDCQC